MKKLSSVWRDVPCSFVSGIWTLHILKLMWVKTFSLHCLFLCLMRSCIYIAIIFKQKAVVFVLVLQGDFNQSLRSCSKHSSVRSLTEWVRPRVLTSSNDRIGFLSVEWAVRVCVSGRVCTGVRKVTYALMEKTPLYLEPPVQAGTCKAQ